MEKYNTKEILDFLSLHGGKEYKSPLKVPDLKQRQDMKNLYKLSRSALGDFNRLLIKVATDNYLTEVINKNFLDGTRRRIRTYFWGQLKNAYYFTNPVSISLFAEKRNTNMAVFRVSLELDQLHSSNDEMKRFIRVLELPLDSGLNYFVSQHGHNNVEVSKDNVNILKSKIEAGEVEKVLIGINVTGADDEILIKNINIAIKKIMPYYNHILSIS